MPKRPTIEIDTASLMRRITVLHQRVYLKSNGRLGGRARGMSFLILRTTGRTSGETRSSILGYVRDGEDLVLVASNNGRDASPDWLENLRRQPRVEVQVGGEEHTGTARIVERGTIDYERLLRLANAKSGWRYFHYQQKTARPIPVVVVTPG